jgi:hypothetical protein
MTLRPVLRVFFLISILLLLSAAGPISTPAQSCCLTPDGEASVVSGGSGGVTLFTVEVFDSYGTSFAGLAVEEALGIASNGCWYNGSNVPKQFAISGGLDEDVNDSNQYLDYIGLNNLTIHAMQLAGANGVSFPCSATWSQAIYIYCPYIDGFEPTPYTLNTDATVIEDRFDISNCRQGTCDPPYLYAP